MIKTILVATDGSNHARKAVELASDIAATYGAGLIILHVMQDGRLPDQGPAAPRGRETGVTSKARRPEGERIIADAEEVARGRGVKLVRTGITDGDPAARIVRRAECEGADLIVLGSRGLGGLRSLLIGSVSRRVCELAKCSSLIVR